MYSALRASLRLLNLLQADLIRPKTSRDDDILNVIPARFWQESSGFHGSAAPITLSLYSFLILIGELGAP